MLNLNEIEGAIVRVDGFPRADWDVIEDSLRSAGIERGREAMARQWTDLVGSFFGDGLRVAESEHFLGLADERAVPVARLLQVAESYREQIHGLLQVAPASRERLVVGAFGDHHAYHAFIETAGDGGRVGASAGMFLSHGYPRIALLAVGDSWRGTLLHELNHAAVRDLDLPQWLDEGIAQVVQAAEFPRSTGMLTEVERLRETKALWHERGLGEFWTGDGFSAPDAAQAAAYDLAFHLVRILVEDHGTGFSAFVQAASYDDHGAAAAEEHLGRTLRQIAATFLGEGPWDPATPERSEPRPADSAIGDALDAVDEGRTADAVRALERAVALEPEAADLHSWLGELHAELDASAALAHHDRALELDPDDPVRLHARGRCLLEIGRVRDAVRDLERATAVDPEEGWCFSLLGEARQRLGDLEGARKAYLRATELDPVLASFRAGYGDALASLGRFEEAVEAHTFAWDLALEDPAFLLGRGRARFGAGDVDGAFADWGEMIERDPEDWWVRYYCGLGHFAVGAWRSAVDELRKALTGCDDDSLLDDLMVHLAFALSKRGLGTEASAVLADEGLSARLDGAGRAVLGFFRGDVDEDALMKARITDPEDRASRFDAAYYASLRHLLRGERYAARGRLEAVQGFADPADLRFLGLTRLLTA